MDRDYNDGKKNDVILSPGREIEKTAYDKETLFVVGIQPEDILKIVNRTNIITVAYSEQLKVLILTGEMGTDDEQEGWDSVMVNTLLKHGLWVTLDYDVKAYIFQLDFGKWIQRK